MRKGMYPERMISVFSKRLGLALLHCGAGVWPGYQPDFSLTVSLKSPLWLLRVLLLAPN
ncbi:MAG: hypothetical protein MESAZ_01214 [Saezia sanguinis]